MANKLLEMRHWAVEALEDGTALLKHKDGHTMFVALSALPRLQQEQIKRIKLDKGGEVEKETSIRELNEREKCRKDYVSGQTYINERMEKGHKKAKEESEKEHYEDGGEVPIGLRPEDVQNTDYTPAVLKHLSSDQMDTKDPISHDTHITINTSPAPGQPAVQTAQASSVTPAPQPDQQQEQVPEAPPVPPAPSTVSPADARQAQVGAYQQYVGKQQNIAAQQQQNADEVRKHVDDFANYIQQNPINPRAYSENQTADQKTNTAIGLLLGGIGGGGRGNVALDFLNKQIDRDIAAQEKNAANRNTVWGAYQHLYEDNNVATNMAKASALDILDNKIKLAAMKIGTPQAQQNAQSFSTLAQQDRNTAINSAAQTLGQKRSFIERMKQHQKDLEAFQNSSISPILAPKADEAFQGLQFNPIAKEDYPAIVGQYTQAQQADKALANLQPTFNKLIQLRTMSGRLGQDVSSHLSGLPLGMGEILGGPTKLATDVFEPKNREYASVQSQLLSDLTNAFRGTNVSGEDIRQVIAKNSPVYADTPEMLKTKRDTLEGFVKRAIPTSLLQKYQLSNK